MGSRSLVFGLAYASLSAAAIAVEAQSPVVTLAGLNTADSVRDARLLRTRNAIIQSAIQRDIGFGPALVRRPLQHGYKVGLSPEAWVALFPARVPAHLRLGWAYTSASQNIRSSASPVRISAWDVVGGTMVEYPVHDRGLPYFTASAGVSRLSLSYAHPGAFQPNPHDALYSAGVYPVIECGVGALLRPPFSIPIADLPVPLSIEVKARRTPGWYRAGALRSRLSFPVTIGIHF